MLYRLTTTIALILLCMYRSLAFNSVRHLKNLRITGLLANTATSTTILKMSTATETKTKPTLPEDYVLPAVWQAPESTIGPSSNLPTAGRRFERELPRGVHEIQLYSLGTPNGHRASIMLEELGIEYDAWQINIGKGDQFSSGFINVNPNGKIPALLDYSEGEPIRVFESGAIILYLADKYKKFIPTDHRGRTECINWMMWGIANNVYLAGGFGHAFHFAPIHVQYYIDRFSMEAKRQLDLVNKQLEDGKPFICGETFTIADITIFTWFRHLREGNDGKSRGFLEMDSYTHVMAWLARVEEREGVKRGLLVNAFSGPDALPERHSKADFEKKATA